MHEMRDFADRPIPLLGEPEVLVCGGGPAGFIAAIAAARSGAKVTLLERYGFLGGMASAGMVNPIYAFFARHLQIVTGIPQELIDRLALVPGGTAGHTYRHDCVNRRTKDGECVTGKDENGCPVASVANVCPVDAEAVKFVAQQMVDQAGVSWHLHTSIVDIRQENGTVHTVVVHGKSGWGVYRPQMIVDATGDADIATWAGAPFQLGSEEDGTNKPPSLMFRVGNVELTKDRIWAAWPKEEAQAAGGTGGWLMALPRQGEYMVNSPTGFRSFDATQTEHLSRGQAEATAQVFKKMELLRKHVRGCENAVLMSIAPQLGIRDSRRIVGLYTLNEDDVLASRKFPDGVANGVHPIDLHTGSARFEGRPLVLTPCGDYYQIPYRCLLPMQVNNVLVAGRSISASFLAQGSLRVMATCMGMGQAAGTAAALCVAGQVPPKQLDPQFLRQKLIEQGAYLGQEFSVPAWNQGSAPIPPEIRPHTRFRGEC